MAVSGQSILNQQGASAKNFTWRCRWNEAYLYGQSYGKKSIESGIFKLDDYGTQISLKLEEDTNGNVQLFICVKQVKHPVSGSLIISYDENSLHYNFFNMSQGNHLALKVKKSNFAHCQYELNVRIKWVESKQRAASIQQPNERSTNDSLIPLSEHLSKLQESEVFSDVVIVTDDGTSFPVHKAILSAWSSVFLAMLETDMSESRKDRIEIKDLSSDTVRNLIRYLYTGRLSTLDYNSASELLYAADKYDVSELKVLCVKRLLQLLDITNALDLLRLMDTYREVSSKETVLKFLSDHREQFTMRDSFHNLLGHPKLLAEILHFMLNS